MLEGRILFVLIVYCIHEPGRRSSVYVVDQSKSIVHVGRSNIFCFDCLLYTWTKMFWRQSS